MILSFLNKRIGNTGRAGKAAGIALSLLLGASLALFGYFFLKLGIVVIAALAVLIAGAFIFFRLYRVNYNNTVILHLICAAAGIYAGIAIYGLCADREPYERIISAVSAGVLTGCVVDLITGFLMNFSGGETNTSHFGKGFLYTLPLFFTAVVFIPSETYFYNYEDFLYIYPDIAPYLIIKTLVLTLLAAVISCGLDKRSFGVFTKMTAGLTLGVYAQYMFMNRSLPHRLGEKADWSALGGEMVINGIVWVLMLALPFIIGAVVKHIKALKENAHAGNVHNYIALFIGGMQFVTLLVMMFTAKFNIFGYNTVLLSGAEQFTVSSQKNVITFILDMADQDFFDDAYAEHPEKFECLKDFTNYRNTNMRFDYTVLSIPEMLTGAQSYPTEKRDEWLEEIWSSEAAEEFYSRLHENNYKVNVFGNFAADYTPLLGKVDTVHTFNPEDITIDREKLFSSVDLISSYRFLPLCLKRYFEPDAFLGNDAVEVVDYCIFKNQKFIDDLTLSADETEKNCFIVEHLQGTHNYYGGIKVETLECLQILDDYFRQLRELGLYDDSVIIVTADHGEHCKADNIPIFYIKGAGETHDELQYSNAPISHTDYLATCLEMMGLYKEGDEALFGRPITAIPEDEQRERLVFQMWGFDAGDAINWDNMGQYDEYGSLFGYYYTGDKSDLKAREQSGAPDIIVEMDYIG